MIRPTVSTLRITLLTLTLAATGRIHAAETAGSEDLFEGLDQAQLQEAFRVLSQHYIQNDSLTYEELNRAALEGLVHRLGFGAEVVRKNGPDEADGEGLTLHQEPLTDEVAYLRPVTFDRDEIEAISQALDEFTEMEMKTLILDLRAPVDQREFARAAACADLFTDSNLLLFKIQKPGESKSQLSLSKKGNAWDGRLVILIDRETSSVAETVAAVIAHYRDCFIIGEKTPGRAVQYQEIALSEDTLLRFASAEVLLPNDTALFNTGVTPQLKSVTPAGKKRRIFIASQKNGLGRYVFDRQRPRMNEAALIVGDNPELEYHLDQSAGRPSPFDKKPLQDRAVQTALESLVTVDFLDIQAAEEDEDETEKEEEDIPAKPKKTDEG